METAEKIKTENSNETAQAVEQEKAVKTKPKKKANDELEKLKAELESQKELLLRTAAEFDNYKRRTERERLSVAEYAKADLLKKLLPVIDNAHRAQSQSSESADYAKGLEMIIRQFIDTFEKTGIEAIGEVGEEFNPTYHEAVMHIEDENLGENVIAEVLSVGYKLGDTVIRAAMVKVAN